MANLQQKDKLGKYTIAFFMSCGFQKLTPLSSYVTSENNNILAIGALTSLQHMASTFSSSQHPHSSLQLDNIRNQASSIILSPFILIGFSRNHVKMVHTNYAAHQFSVAGKCLVMRFQY